MTSEHVWKDGRPPTSPVTDKRGQLRAEWDRLDAAFPQFQLREKWTLGWDPRSKRRVGVCRHSQRRVEISEWAIKKLPVEKLLNTLRHEVGHVAAGQGAGHGPSWLAWAKELGFRPETATRLPPEEKEPFKYGFVCESCGLIPGTGWYRQPKAGKRTHRKCGNPGVVVRLDESGRIVSPGNWTERSKPLW